MKRLSQELSVCVFGYVIGLFWISLCFSLFVSHVWSLTVSVCCIMTDRRGGVRWWPHVSQPSTFCVLGVTPRAHHQHRVTSTPLAMQTSPLLQSVSQLYHTLYSRTLISCYFNSVCAKRHSSTRVTLSAWLFFSVAHLEKCLYIFRLNYLAWNKYNQS